MSDDLSKPLRDKPGAEKRLAEIFADIETNKHDDLRGRIDSAMQHIYDYKNLLGLDYMMDKYVFPACEKYFPDEPGVLEDMSNILLNYEEEKYSHYTRFLQRLMAQYKDDELAAYVRGAYVLYDAGYLPKDLNRLIADLIRNLDEELPVRSAAALSLGYIYAEYYDVDFAVSGEELLKLITDKELASSGVAAPYYSAYDGEAGRFSEIGNIDAREWLVELEKNIRQPEPELHYTLTVRQLLGRM